MKSYSTREAAETLLGWKGKHCASRLWHAIRKQEKKIGIEIAERRKAPNGKEWLYVSENALRRHMPHLFDASPIELANEIRSRIVTIQESVSEQISTQIDERMRIGQRHASTILAEIKRVEAGLLTETGRLARRIEEIERVISKTD